MVCQTFLVFCSGLAHWWCLERQDTGAMCEAGWSYPSVRTASCAAHEIPHLGWAGRIPTHFTWPDVCFCLSCQNVTSHCQISRVDFYSRVSSPGSWPQIWSIFRKTCSLRKQMCTGLYPTLDLVPTEMLIVTEKHIPSWWRSKWVFYSDIFPFFKPTDLIGVQFVGWVKAFFFFFRLLKKQFQKSPVVLFMLSYLILQKIGLPLSFFNLFISFISHACLCNLASGLFHYVTLILRFHVKSGARFFWRKWSGMLCWSTHWWHGATPVSCHSGTQQTTTLSENSVTAFWQLTASQLFSTTAPSPAEHVNCSEGNSHC